jgi:multiple sugar transport system permease protein
MAVMSKVGVSVPLASRRKGMTISKREAMWGMIFLSPWIVGILAFTAIPMVASLILSLTNYNPIHPEELRFIGLHNFTRFFGDPGMRQAAGVTLRFVLISVPLSVIIPLGLAVLVNAKHLFGKNIFRALFYMPYMIPAVVGVMVWGGILNSDSGWLNRFLSMVGIEGPRWLQDENWVVPSIVIMGFWGVGNAMLIFLAGLQNVPTELFEAAKVDGAGPIYTFFKITVPMISPVIFYNLTLALIGSFQVFVPGYIIGNGRGDPNGATMFYNIYLYKTAFDFQDMGYGTTLAWAMFIVVLILTIIMFKTQNRWVYYAGGEE